MTDNSVTDHFLHESDMQASIFYDQCAQIESKLDLSHSGTGIHDPSARVAAISTVDKGIDAAKQFVRSLITRRNALVPIFLLPPEILARVFHLIVLEEPILPETRSLGWIRVTHVCQHWRQVALDDSSLWARIWGIPTNTKWILEMLARAKNAPLDIELDVGAGASQQALLMIPPHISHTRQLRFHDLSAANSDSVREIFSWEAPALEHFELTVTAYPNDPLVTLSKRGGNMLFKGHTPRLRTFIFSRVVIPWSLIPRGQLTQLKIARPNEDVDSPGDLDQFIDLLVNCPALEILELDSCLPSQLTELPHGRTIHLPHLSRLRLCGSTYLIRCMLGMLKLPSSTTLRLYCIHKITSIDDNEEDILLADIAAQFQSPVPIEFKSLTVTTPRHSTSSLSITASTFPSTLRNHQTQNFEGDIVSDAELVLSFAFDRLSNPGHSTDLLRLACRILPISNLEFISMSATNVIDINWVELFSRCTNVTTMQAIGRGTSSLVRALTAPTVTNARSSNEGREGKHENGESTLVQPASTVAHAHAAIFPKLKVLGLTEQNFSEGKHTSDIPFDVFERGLEQRMEASGARLKLLRIRDCNISTEHANDLQNLVEEIHWDETEGSIDGFDYYEHNFSDDPGEDVFIGHGTALRDSDSDGWDDYTDRLTWDDAYSVYSDGY